MNDVCSLLPLKNPYTAVILFFGWKGMQPTTKFSLFFDEANGVNNTYSECLREVLNQSIVTLY